MAKTWFVSKNQKNKFDDDAIAVYCNDDIEKVGYVANSYATRARGTASAVRIYDLFEKKILVKVCFIDDNTVICRMCQVHFVEIFSVKTNKNYGENNDAHSKS